MNNENVDVVSQIAAVELRIAQALQSLMIPTATPDDASWRKAVLQPQIEDLEAQLSRLREREQQRIVDPLDA